MKKKTDPRHQKRAKIIQSLFAWTIQSKKEQPRNKNLRPIIDKIGQIDNLIQKHAPQWPVEQIAPVDLAILRLSIWEICFFKKTPVKVAIDEAVELAKEFGSETSSSFVNGVLGSVVEVERKNK